MKLTILSPTYNERDNLDRLMSELERVLAGLDYEVLIVDDDSPDRTWEKVEEMSKTRPYLRVLRRMDKKDYWSAIVDGFKAASGDAVGTIDADLQHDPNILPKMFAELEAGADLVIGSRYMPGGGTSNWNWFRRLMSETANMASRVVLRAKVADPGAGIFMLRKADFLRIADKLHGKGYRILIDIIVNLRPKNIKEVPYTFRPRQIGESKMSFGIVFNYLKLLLRLTFTRRA